MKYFVLAVALLLAGYRVSAQGSVSRIVKGEDVNFTELSNYFHAHPNPLVRKKMFDEDGDKEARPVRVGDTALERMIHRPSGSRGAEAPHSALLPASPAPTDTFESSISDFTSIPPDTHGMVDSTYCVSAINDSVTIRTRAGAYVSGVQLDDFWSSLETHGAGAYDPRIHYDPHFGRWIFVTDCYGETVNSTIFVAVSATGDPTGSWHMFSLYVGDAAGDWLDFPCVGFNSKWVAVSGNIFSSAGSYNNDVIYVFNYADLRADITPTYTELLPASLDPNSFCIAPALTYDTAEQNLYGMEVYDGSHGKLEEWKISGTVSAPTLSIVGNPTGTTHWQQQGAGGSDFATQLGTTDKLQTNDDRINNLQQRNGNLWCAHTAFLPASGTATSCGAMWWEIDTTGTPVQNGLVTGPGGSSSTSSSTFCAFPSIAVNINGDALMGFAYLSSAVHPCGAYTLHLHTDANDSMRPMNIFRHGQRPYYQTFGGSDNRWGDYSSTCIDPRNNTDFWTIQESVPDYTGTIDNSIWDTWWAYVQVCPTLSAPTGSASATQCSGTTATYTVAAVTGATGYTWTVSGSGFSGSSTTTSIVLTAGTGVATVTAAANNSCGAGTPYTFTVTGITTPVAPVISTVAPACAGSSSAAFSAAAATATSYNWTVLGAGWSGSSTTSSITTTVGAGTGTIIASGINACGTGAADTIMVTPGTAPTAATEIDSSAVLCSGSTITFTTPAVAGATSYTWAVSGTGWSSTPGTSSSISVVIGTGTANITVTPVNGCGSGVPFTISGIAAVVTPTVTFTASAHVTTTGVTDLFTYTGTAVTGPTYTWNFDGGTATPGGSAGTQSVIWTTTGLKTITLSVTNNGCTSAVYTDTVLVNFPAAVPQVGAPQLTETILPNPNDGTFAISFSRTVNKPVTVKVIDMLGRGVYFNKFNVPGNTINIVTDNLPSGTYTVNVEIDGRVITDKITISK